MRKTMEGRRTLRKHFALFFPLALRPIDPSLSFSPCRKMRIFGWKTSFPPCKPSDRADIALAPRCVSSTIVGAPEVAAARSAKEARERRCMFDEVGGGGRAQ